MTRSALKVGKKYHLGENLAGGWQKRVGGLAELGGLHDREADAARDGAGDHGTGKMWGRSLGHAGSP